MKETGEFEGGIRRRSTTATPARSAGSVRVGARSHHQTAGQQLASMQKPLTRTARPRFARILGHPCAHPNTRKLPSGRVGGVVDVCSAVPSWADIDSHLTARPPAPTGTRTYGPAPESTSPGALLTSGFGVRVPDGPLAFPVLTCIFSPSRGRGVCLITGCEAAVRPGRLSPGSLEAAGEPSSSDATASAAALWSSASPLV